MDFSLTDQQQALCASLLELWQDVVAPCDAKLAGICGGTTEIQRLIIGRTLLG